MSVFRIVYRLFIRGYSGDNEAPTVLSVESITGIYLFITGVTGTAASLGRLWDVSWSPHKVCGQRYNISGRGDTAGNAASGRVNFRPVVTDSDPSRGETGLYTALSTCGHHSLLYNC